MRRFMVAAMLLALSDSAQAEREVFGQWMYEEIKDAITDAPIINAGIARADGALLFRCEEKIFIAYVQLEAVDFFFEDTRQVTYRVDSDPPKTATFQRGRRGGSLAAGEVAVKMAHEVARASATIALRSAGRTVVLPLGGAREAVEKMLERCPNKAARLGAAR